MHKDNLRIFVIGLFLSFAIKLISLTFLLNYDEWYYLASWNGIKNGGILYKTILDNKPPLAYFLYAIPDIISVYVTLSILSAIIAFYLYKISENIVAGHIFLFITSAIPSYTELNLEYWILACILPVYYFILKKNTVFWHSLAYFLCGTSLMIKQHSLLLIIPILLYGLLKHKRLFWKGISWLFLVPLLCLFYIVYTNTLYPAYECIIKYNLWYKDLSETGGYIWKRFVYGQLFPLPVYAGILFSIKNIHKQVLSVLWIIVLTLAVSSVWIGKELYLHYQILIFPFLILLFYEISIQKYQKYVYISMLFVCVFGQANCMYTYLYNRKTWLTNTEGVLSYQEIKKIIPLKTDKFIVFSAQSTIGLDYHKVKYIALCRSMEYLKKQNGASRQLFSFDFYLKDAVYVVSKPCLDEYVGDMKYKVVYDYQDNIGIMIEECK